MKNFTIVAGPSGTGFTVTDTATGQSISGFDTIQFSVDAAGQSIAQFGVYSFTATVTNGAEPTPSPTPAPTPTPTPAPAPGSA